MEESSEGRIRVLIVDDEEGARESLDLILEDLCDVETLADGAGALERIKEISFDLVLLDITMPEMNGIETLKRIKQYDDSIDVIMVSAMDRAHEATTSMRYGAYDYITKPFEPEEILATVERVIKKRSLEQEVRYLRSEMAFKFGDTQIVSQSTSMQSVFRLIEKVARTSSGVLITGESGTGKELIARAIHVKSDRRNKPFVTINCAAMPPELMESELFGHERGAFTGAHHRTVGKFEFAHGGTIFLDEISSLRLELQAKLLRILQEREFTRVGSHQTIKVDVRVIAATNTRLDEMAKAGQFRSDLYFRLNIIPISLPPLRERHGDIPLLCEYFLEKLRRTLHKKIAGITPEALNVLESYPWPGNVRELENMVERLVVLSSDGHWIDENDLPFDLLIPEEPCDTAPEGQSVDSGLLHARQTFERQYILRALQRCRWNQTDTARLLKIHRNTLLLKMKALHLHFETTQ